MSDELLPESIRGGWFLLPPDRDPQEVPSAGGEFITFRLDGTFIRYDIGGTTREEAGRGDYTFDGNFLILRGRRTTTFRVQPLTEWCWEAEAKKKERRLLRGLVRCEKQPDLTDEDVREIEVLPGRIRVRSYFDGDHDSDVSEFVFEPETGPSRVVGACSAEPVSEGNLWLGLTPMVGGIEAPLWGSIVREAYLKVYRDDASSLDRVTIELLDQQETIEIRPDGS